MSKGAKTEDTTPQQPPQTQPHQPGIESLMRPRPVFVRLSYVGSGKLTDRVALVTGGDSGIGRAVAVHFAMEGAHVAIAYLEEHEDAQETQRLVQAEGRRAELYPGDIGDVEICRSIVADVVKHFGQLDILVNNAAEQHTVEDFADLTPEQFERTFRTNVFGAFHLTSAALPHLKKGASIINTSSVTAFRGSPALVDYSATKGALVAFTRSLAQQLAERGIRVNGVAPGPIWTPLIPASFDAEKVAEFGSDTPLGRVGQPAEVAPAYVFLASEDGSYMTGQFLHPNGGDFTA